MSNPQHNPAVDDGFDAHTAVRSARLELADYLDRLDPNDWNRPSLCGGWTIEEVVAHLTLSTTGTWTGFIVGMIRNLGNFDRWNAESAREQARRHTPDELVSMLRDQADTNDHSPGSSTLDQLVDLLVHGQDISRAVSSPLDTPPHATAVALDHTLASRWYGARKRFEGLRLTATDIDWRTENGNEVRGAVISLLLLATGRNAGLTEVTGPGVESLKRRLRST